MPPADTTLVLSCEHGGNMIPARYRPLFKGAATVLRSHRGWDPGSLELARTIRRATRAPLIATTTSRLLVECNRSIGHPRLFSEFTRSLDERDKAQLLKTYYHPHRDAVERAIHDRMRTVHRVVHIGVHTFTPVYEGRRRTVDIGVLHDPRRAFESGVACALVGALKTATPGLKVYRNLPYRGWSDGLTTSLRETFPASRYAGIELEVSQRFVGTARWRALQRSIASAIRAQG
ncbi:MAG: N-formylglutamate amidohydrolase [Candidatus Krumholzibacteria bacterium]|nr:N-formylglutamate amidohydrolase [Candidatus Krumholzibacteria bacterium]MDH4337366.1 N-formylglutamate amidohydrolase [Candidatus Krumholzibacteria bacterium]MDH5270127.1 N-formylglutamate amidohydrolase [Candidatus Krumholzibacteria bacterium]